MQQLLAKLHQVNNYHTMAATYENTLTLLHALKDGTISLDNVVLSAGGWQLKPDEPAPVSEPIPECAPASETSAVPETAESVAVVTPESHAEKSPSAA